MLGSKSLKKGQKMLKKATNLIQNTFFEKKNGLELTYHFLNLLATAIKSGFFCKLITWHSSLAGRIWPEKDDF